MKKPLLKVQIQNFKSIKELDFEIGNEIKYLVGKNECGKSNILDAISRIKEDKLLKTEEKNFNSDEKKLGIAYYRELSESLLKKLNHLFGKEHGSNFEFSWKTFSVNKNQTIFDENFCKIIFLFIKDLLINKKLISSLDEVFQKQINLFLKDFSKSQKTDLLKILNSNLLHELVAKSSGTKGLAKLSELNKLLLESEKPESMHFEIFNFNDSKKLLKEKYTFSEALTDEQFISFWKLFFDNIEDIQKLKKLQGEPKQFGFLQFKSELQEKMKNKIKFFIDDFLTQKTIHFKIYIEDDFFVISAADTFIDDKSEDIKYGEYREINIRSEGMRHHLSLLLFLHTIKYNDNKKKIILFDEPDLHMHALAVRDFKRYLEKLIKKYKNLGIVIATHNPFFVDEDNLRQITFVEKNKNEGTKCINKFAFQSNKESVSTLSPFLYSIGIDRKSFIELVDSRPVFVEGAHDMLLFNGMKCYLNDNKYNNLLFIPIGGVTKIPTLVNTITALTKKIPYFIFDYDRAGSLGLKMIKNTSFYRKDLKNAFFNNFKEDYVPNDLIKKHEIQNLFTNETFEGAEISKNKETMFYLRLWKALKSKNGDIKISKETKVKFENIFKRITKNLKNVD